MAGLAAIVSLSAVMVAVGILPHASAAACNPVPHGAIRISSDADFTGANGVVSGSGSPADPYVLANLAINDMSAGYGLEIDNSQHGISVTFNIACVASNWKVASSAGGALVHLKGITTPTTVSLLMSNSGELPNSVGLRVEGSSHLLLMDESFNKMGGDGIQIVGSSFITILDSKSKAAGNGLLIQDSHDIVVGQACAVGGGQGCDEFTYDDNRGILIQDSQNIQVIDTMTSADDSGGILITGPLTSGISLSGGEATANGPICHAKTASGYVSDTITGIAIVDGAHDVSVTGYTVQANGDGGGGYFDIMNGGKGLYLSPCGTLLTLPATPPAGANIGFTDTCYRFEFGFNPAPPSSC